MTTTDQRRIERSRTRPAILRLWQAMAPLRSVVRFMNTGAHPDDETSAMLAALHFRDGLNVSYACATRGEGGQNDIGTEAGSQLGALRTAEMEKAAEALGMRLYWLSEGPDDTISDFGFSKGGDETLSRWGEARTLARFVEIVRTEKPDILCPTFLDIPGQHGHHRAMTSMAHRVFEAAANPGFAASKLEPWQVSKLYLPAWSGAGRSYDDDLPPPEPTVTIDGQGRDPVSNWSWALIGQQSRAFHRTQGMGHWPDIDSARDWPLHLAESTLSGPDTALADGLLGSLGDCADLPGAATIAADLHAAQSGIDAIFDAFPDADRVAALAAAALKSVRQAQRDCPDDLKADLRHRLSSKTVQLQRVAYYALGIDADARTDTPWVQPETSVGLTIGLFTGAADSAGTSPELPTAWRHEDGAFEMGQYAAPDTGFRAAFDPLEPPRPSVAVSFKANDVPMTVCVPFDPPPVALPDRQVRLAEDRACVNLSRGQRTARFPVMAGGKALTASVPDGWRAEVEAGALVVTVPESADPGRYGLPLNVDGEPARFAHRIAYDHIDATVSNTPAEVFVGVLRTEVPDARIGFIGAGNDRVHHWLSAAGADTVDLSAGPIDAATLSDFDTIVIGIFAMRFAPGLWESRSVLHEWVRDGGNLVTLYHRPWDNWDPDTTPPKRLEIGQPSLRWRVTDETAQVRHLQPEHPLLNGPNRIGPDTWTGWSKERGLYFAKSWDPAYLPLLEMADPGEAPLTGGLLAADIGAGRHIHTSLILHHQLEQLVPGAFDLMCNLIAKPG